MNRDIKFKVWDNHKQCWVRRTDAIYLSPNTDGIYSLRVKSGERYTVVEYIGLNDCNNTRIFEGDIVRHSELGIGEVVMEGSGFTIMFDVDSLPPGTDGHENDPRTIEVVGNIFEHKGLLS